MTHTFTDKDGLFTFTVKKEFLERCPNPQELNIETLTSTHEINKFFHNPNGFAVVYNNKLPEKVLEKIASHSAIHRDANGVLGACWLDGNILTGDDAKKFLHDVNFMDKVDEFLTKEDKASNE